VLSVLREIALIALLAAVACAVVGWVLPLVLQAAAEPLTDGVAFVAAVLLLPEYWLSTAVRERRGSPPAISYQEPGPLRWAAVEAGKWGRVRPGRRSYCDALSSWTRMVLGATDRNCRLLP
jgi:hypothetical protein